MKRSAWLSAAVMAAVVFSAASAFAEDGWVSADVVVLRAGKNAIYDPISDLHKGDKLTVLEHSGGWLKVNCNGKEGYVPQRAVSGQSVSGDVNIFKPMANTGSVTEGAADRPLRDGAVNYAKGKHLNPQFMKWIEDFRRDLRKAPSELDVFMQEGGVGNAAPQ